jgi:hypothetical protein
MKVVADRAGESGIAVKRYIGWKWTGYTPALSRKIK